MARETLRLHDYGYFGDKPKPDKTVEVEYRPTDHWSSDDSLRAYEVVIDGGVVGKVWQVRANTTRPAGRGSRLVVHQKGSIEWMWESTRRGKSGVRRNSPGLYARTRRAAVAEILGYSTAEKV